MKQMLPILKPCDRYLIAKVKLSDGSCFFCSEYECDVEFNGTGKITDAWDSETFSCCGFRNSFIPFPDPFERGDIVKSCESGRIGIVETPREK